MDKGAFIMHRIHGSTTDITPDARRAVTKMKATITQRFELDGCEVDAEADCRFCFFWERVDLAAGHGQGVGEGQGECEHNLTGGRGRAEEGRRGKWLRGAWQ